MSVLPAPPHPLPSGPCYAVIISMRLKQLDPAYVQAGRRMAELAASQPGFLGHEQAHNADGSALAVSYWQSLEAIAAWRAHPEHQAVQARGRQDWWAQYTIRVARVERVHGCGV